MTHCLRYHSSRSEVWNWYWQNWKKKFWKQHILFAIVIGLYFSSSNLNIFNFKSWIVTSLISLPIITFLMALWPQIMFKNSERILQIDNEGWTSTISNKHGSRSWNEVDYIRDEANTVVIAGTNGNALIIPLRAFPDEESRKQFLEDAIKWHKNKNHE